MEFIHKKKEYSPRELYESFGDKLPLIVVCTQGFLGEKGWDTVGQGSVFRFHAVSRQARVTAKVRIRNTTRTISIPRSYPEKVILVGEKRERTLDDILRHHRLPCEVGFPKERNIVMGERTINTTNLPNLTLTGTFDELHFLGFSICDGFLEKEVTAVPLYLSRVRFAIVRGARDKTHDYWKEYTRDLDDQIKYRYLTYGLSYGNPDIAQYHSEGAEVESSEISFVEPQEYYNFGKLFRAYEDDVIRGETHKKEEEIVAEGEYEPVVVGAKRTKSKAYAPLPPVVDSEPEDKEADYYNHQNLRYKLYLNENDDLYENTCHDALGHSSTKTDFTNRSPIKCKSDDMYANQSSTTMDQTEQKTIFVNRNSCNVEGSSSFQNELKLTLLNLKPVRRAKSTFVCEQTDVITNSDCKAEPADKRIQNCVGARPKLEPFIEFKNSSETSGTNKQLKPKPTIKPKPNSLQSQTHDANENQSVLTSIITNSEKTPCTTESQHKQKATIAPMSSVKQSSQKTQNVLSTSTHDHNSLSPLGQTDAASIYLPEDPNSLGALPTVNSIEDVKRLTVNEVAAYLRVLNLASYANEFIAQSVDGVLLTQLQKEEIERDFGMKGVEARRLVNFSQKAHIPRH